MLAPMSGGPNATALNPNRERFEAALNAVLVRIQADNEIPQWVDVVGGPSVFTSPTTSGISELDYQALTSHSGTINSPASNNSIFGAPLSLVKEERRTALPQELIQHLQTMQCHSDVGVFPEVSRAWAIVDSDILLWSYLTGEDVVYYDGFNELVLCIGLVKPKPDIFQSFVHYLLVVATTAEIAVLGVTIAENTLTHATELHFLSEPLFSLSADNAFATCIVGTEQGRIFLGAKDGSLYELFYQSQSSWLSKQVRLINHTSSLLGVLVPSIISYAFTAEDPLRQIEIDDSRNILYTCSEKGTISVFDLGPAGDSMSRVVTIKQDALFRSVAIANKNIEPSHLKKIVHIEAVPISESLEMQLIVVTQSGARLYLTTASAPVRLERPIGLNLLHIRLPVALPHRLGDVHKARSTKGTTVFLDTQCDFRPMVLVLDADSFAFRSPYTEAFSVLPLDPTLVDTNGLWCLKPLMMPMPPYALSRVLPPGTTFSEQTAVPCQPPLLLTQHLATIPTVNYILVSSQGCQIISKLRPVDQLKQLLLDYRGAKADAVKAFFNLHGEIESCVMCVILSCSPASDPQLQDWAKDAFLMYGGEPHFTPSTAALPMNPYGHFEHQASGPYGPGSMHPAIGSSVSQGPPHALHHTFDQTQLLSQTPAIGSMPFGQHPQGFHPVMSTPMRHSFMQPPSYMASPIHPAGPFAPQMGPPMRRGSPPAPQQGMMAAPQPLQPQLLLQHSPRHDALYTYYARVIRPIFDRKLTVPIKAPGSDAILLNVELGGEDLLPIMGALRALKRFLEKLLKTSDDSGQIAPRSGAPIIMNSQQQFIMAMQQQSQQQTMSEHEQQVLRTRHAYLQEAASLMNLLHLINYTLEVLSLWKVVCDHDLPSISAAMSNELSNQLRNAVFRDLLTADRSVCATLATCVVDTYLRDGTTTEAISSRLRTSCPSMFGDEDALYTRAHEQLVKAANVANQREREAMLADALKLCRQIASHNMNLAAVCNLLHSVNYHEGLVSVCLSRAAALDPQNMALHYVKQGEPLEDDRGRSAYLTRMECYRLITDSLYQLLQRATAKSDAPAKTDRRQQMDTLNLLDNSGHALDALGQTENAANDPVQMYEEMLNICLDTKDELFHIALYNWLCDMQQAERLLRVTTPYLEQYLDRIAKMHDGDPTYLNLVWRYQEIHRNYYAAAKVLTQLAEKPGCDLSIGDRVEYLSRAVLCLKSAPHSDGLIALEERLEVARIQQKILDTLRATQPQAHEAISALNRQLFDITKLYTDFAEEFQLAECKLCILQATNHDDPVLVETLWVQIIDQLIANTAGQAPQTRSNLLRSQLQKVAQNYVSSKRCFPLPLIVKYAELKTCQLDMDPTWLPNTILALGISLITLQETYHTLYKTRDHREWSRKPRHLLSVQAKLIQMFVESPNLVAATHRRSFTNKCLDDISGYLVDLQAGLATLDTGLEPLINSFRSLRASLERLVC